MVTPSRCDVLYNPTSGIGTGHGLQVQLSEDCGESTLIITGSATIFILYCMISMRLQTFDHSYLRLGLKTLMTKERIYLATGGWPVVVGSNAFMRRPVTSSWKDSLCDGRASTPNPFALLCFAQDLLNSSYFQACLLIRILLTAWKFKPNSLIRATLSVRFRNPNLTFMGA